MVIIEFYLLHAAYNSQKVFIQNFSLSIDVRLIGLTGRKNPGLLGEVGIYGIH